jgi:hypothetical protein
VLQQAAESGHQAESLRRGAAARASQAPGVGFAKVLVDSVLCEDSIGLVHHGLLPSSENSIARFWISEQGRFSR